MASTGQVVAVGEDNGHPRQVAYTVDGTIAGAFTWPSAGSMDSLEAVATDDFGGFYVTGAVTVAPNNVKVFSGRGSLLTGGAGWISLSGSARSIGNEPYAIAVGGTTCVVVGDLQHLRAHRR